MELPNSKPSALELLPRHPFPSDPWVDMNDIEPKAERRDHYPTMGTHLFVHETDLESVRNVQLGRDAGVMRPFIRKGSLSSWDNPRVLMWIEFVLNSCGILTNIHCPR